MIYEYAIDPEFIFKLADQTLIANILHTNIGYGTPFVIAGYPNKLGYETRAIAKNAEAQATDQKLKARAQLRLHRTEDLAAKLAGPAAAATKRYNAGEWNGRFDDEHSRFPFQGVLSGSNSAAASGLPFHDVDWFSKPDCHILNCPRSLIVQRTAQGLCEALKPMLQNASIIKFIDPYFNPNTRNSRFVVPFSEYFKCISEANHVRIQDNNREIQIICAVNQGTNDNSTSEQFASDCKNILSPGLPKGVTLRLHRFKEKVGGQEIHNRYILTDIGGVLFGHGTDSSPADSYDDICLLDRDSFFRWNAAYEPNSKDFDWSEPCIEINSTSGVSHAAR
ncbi:hypothetical protein FACS189460_0430 [Deltaproteobacteria bacterium]|nr:hypothetical protein FACS189460_0430 [Deltaproteobacteria bacterium]